MPCLPGSKLPASSVIRRRTRGTSSWKTYERRHATADEIASWAELEPRHNLAVVLGETSDGLVAIDVDAELPAGVSIPPTATVYSPRGRHFYARADAHAATRRFPWGEFRAEGSYIVVPESQTIKRYEWASTPAEGIAALEEFELPALVSCSRAEVSRPTPTYPGYLSLLGRAPSYAEALGITDFRGLGKAFRCVVHPESHPSAALWPHRETGVLYYVEHHYADEKRLTLPKLYARLHGWTGPLAKPSYRTWSLRLDVDAGIRAPVAVPVKEVPFDTPEDVRRLYEAFLHVFACKWHDDHGAPSAFSYRFAAAWSGLSKATVEKCFPELRALGLVHFAGHDGRGTALWLPAKGGMPLRRTR